MKSSSMDLTHKMMLMYAMVLSCFVANTQVIDNITLNETNHVTIHGSINDRTVKQFLVKASGMSPHSNQYVYINSPGGSVMAGNRIVRHVKSHNYTCVADHAASMAFVIFQACKHRVVMDTSVLMQHQQSLSVDGNLENINNYLHMANAVNEDLTLMQATRLNMTVNSFKDKTTNDWWLYGKEILDANAADAIVHNIECDRALYQQEYTRKEPMGFFGLEVNVTYSACPLVNGIM